MEATPPDPGCSGPLVPVGGSASRALVRELGTTAWTVLLDVSLDARSEAARWAARTSVRVIAAHLGLTAGTEARALARLNAAALVHRQDRRDLVTGRFVESVYLVAPTAGIVTCVDCPHTAEPPTAEPHTAGSHAPVRSPGYRDAGQPSPFSMASVCRPLSCGDRARRASTSEVEAGLRARGNRQRGDGDIVAFSPGSASC
jgi:hypothetical protein